MELLIADTFTDSLARLTGDEQRSALFVKIPSVAHPISQTAHVHPALRTAKRLQEELPLTNRTRTLLSACAHPIRCETVARPAGVAELADALDSKSSTRKSVWVRTPPPVAGPASKKIPITNYQVGK